MGGLSRGRRRDGERRRGTLPHLLRRGGKEGTRHLHHARVQPGFTPEVPGQVFRDRVHTADRGLVSGVQDQRALGRPHQEEDRLQDAPRGTPGQQLRPQRRIRKLIDRLSLIF